MEPDMTDRLAGKTCLITAAGAGIGRATALACQKAGAKVLAVDIDQGALSALQKAAPEIEIRQVDVREDAAVKALSAHNVDVLFNVAGYVHSGSVLDCRAEDWAFAQDLNVTSMIRTIQAILPGMLERKAGSIINMASVASSIRGVQNRFIYSTTKAAVIGLTKSIAADFVAYGIRCNAIAPGTIDTPSLQARLSATGDYETAFASFKARQPMGRLGTTEEIASLGVYLASDESAFTTGAVHVIDGGWTM
jgi:2-keto-3-deoxy-L-fuconate dehydrogenase